MPKYFTQRDQFRCGPIAYLNLLSWLGYKRTRRDIDAVTERLQCNQEEGTACDVLYKVLKKLKSIKVTHRLSWTNAEFLGRLKKGRPVILTFLSIKTDNHVVFIPGIDPITDKYIITNMYENSTYSLLSEEELLKLTKNKVDCFFITRKEKERKKGSNKIDQTVLALANSVFVSKKFALNWLQTPQMGLGNRLPIEVMTTEEGIQDVKDLLIRIDHGVIF